MHDVWSHEIDPFSIFDDYSAACSDSSATVVIFDAFVHVCLGLECSHLQPDDDQGYTCSKSRLFVSLRNKSNTDASWTGRSNQSNDPDMKAGGVGGSWRKRDSLALSVAAG